MIFNFIPYHLNQDISEFGNEITYIDTDNGIDLYRVDKHISLINILFLGINLYFYERKLITVYLHLADSVDKIDEIIDKLQNEIKVSAVIKHTDTGVVYSWANNGEYLGLVNSNTGSKSLYLYYALKEYSVYQ